MPRWGQATGKLAYHKTNQTTELSRIPCQPNSGQIKMIKKQRRENYSSSAIIRNAVISEFAFRFSNAKLSE